MDEKSLSKSILHLSNNISSLLSAQIVSIAVNLSQDKTDDSIHKEINRAIKFVNFTNNQLKAKKLQ